MQRNYLRVHRVCGNRNATAVFDEVDASGAARQKFRNSLAEALAADAIKRSQRRAGLRRSTFSLDRHSKKRQKTSEKRKKSGQKWKKNAVLRQKLTTKVHETARTLSRLRAPMICHKRYSRGVSLSKDRNLYTRCHYEKSKVYFRQAAAAHCYFCYRAGSCTLVALGRGDKRRKSPDVTE